MKLGTEYKLLAVIDGGPVGDLIREFGTELQGIGIALVAFVVIALGVKLALSVFSSNQGEGRGGMRAAVGALGVVFVAVLLIGSAFILVPILFSTTGT